MTKPRIGQSGNWDRERADRLQEDVERMQKDVERLERWKVEACEVMNGLQELGKALGLRPGVQITGPAALAEVARLTAERDAAIERLERVIDQWRKTGRAVISEMNRADKAEAERDALIAVGKRQAARLARVEALAEEWDGDDSCDNRTCVPHRSADALRAVLAGFEADTSGQERCPTCAKTRDDLTPGPHAEGWGHCPESFHFRNISTDQEVK